MEDVLISVKFIFQVEEEQMLQNELRKIEARKKERDKKTQDLQKLITAADNQGGQDRKIERKIPRKKIPPAAHLRNPRVENFVSIHCLSAFLIPHYFLH